MPALWSNQAAGSAGIGGCVLGATPKAQWTANALTFSGQVGVTSPAATATLQNTGNAELEIHSGASQHFGSAVSIKGPAPPPSSL